MFKLCCAHTTILVALLLLPAHKANGQWHAGLEAGMASNILHTDISNRNYTTINSLNAFTAGGVLSYDANSWLVLTALPSYAMKNYQVSRSGYYAGIYQDTKNSYFQLPLGAGAHHRFGKFTASIAAGLYEAFWYASRIKGVQPNILNNAPYGSGPLLQYNLPYRYNEAQSIDSVKGNHWETGYWCRAAAGYAINKRLAATLACAYYYAVTGQQKNYMTNQVPAYNQTMVITAGLTYSFHKKN